MLEEICNIWDKHDQGHWVCITTNYGWKKDRRNVMGAGVAYQAKQRFPGIDLWYGQQCRSYYDRYALPYIRIFYRSDLRLIFFATKKLDVSAPWLSWKSDSSLEQIAQSAKSLSKRLYLFDGPVYLPRPGCANGGLHWPTVKQLLDPILPDQVIVVTNDPRP